MGVRHGIFTRLGGVSPAPFDSLNTATTGGDTRENVTENVGRMFQALGLDISTRYDGWQRHTKNVLAADAPRDMSLPPVEADGLVTVNPNVTLLERFGDCVPVMLYDPVVKAAAVCHAGWPGTVDNICAITVEKMKSLYGCDPKNMIAGIGPSIGPDHFEVKEDVASLFRKAFVCGGSEKDQRASSPSRNRRSSGLRGSRLAAMFRRIRSGEPVAHTAKRFISDEKT